ncbi:P1 family peptidase [Acidimicrobiia bacterium EGI L10123]|uniref:P1 family peptidase n=1 Tax=Salinilacustrithrix flava TaxID=2957203 RepID=UPI003D7C2306|nr:P1 family peptidase [Acidimicrobiia bacterium EGI L10123]
MVTDVEGVRVGHWTDAEARTGCTVVLLPEGTVASGEVRGGAPATREFALLDPTRMVTRLDAVVLSGGSAFGLAAADGVMAHLAEAGVGFETVGGPVPIVVGMSLYDLAVGDPAVRPTAQHGRIAAEAATGGAVSTGLVGAGTGATVAKWRGPEHRRPGALVAATRRGRDGLVVAALVAVNAFGEPGADPGDVAEGSVAGSDLARGAPGTNTTIGVVVTNARLDKVACHLLAQSAHHGLARSVAPSHTSVDGDAFVAAATGKVDAEVAVVRNLAVAAVSDAVLTLAGSG